MNDPIGYVFRSMLRGFGWGMGRQAAYRAGRSRVGGRGGRGLWLVIAVVVILYVIGSHT
jgi:hypothetical protein